MEKNIDKEILNSLYHFVPKNKIRKIEEFATYRTNYLTVALENIFQEHNASAVMRTCDCLGIQTVHTIEKNNEYLIRKEISRGAGNWVDLVNFDSKTSPTTECLNHLKKQGYKIVATSPHKNDCTPDNLPIDQPLALFFGTEMEGISDEIHNNADYFLKIPMYGFTESFNISVSAAIILNELRNRLLKSSMQFTLNENEQDLLKIKWCTKILRNGSEVEKEIRKRILEKMK